MDSFLKLLDPISRFAGSAEIEEAIFQTKKNEQAQKLVFGLILFFYVVAILEDVCRHKNVVHKNFADLIKISVSFMAKNVLLFLITHEECGTSGE